MLFFGKKKKPKKAESAAPDGKPDGKVVPSPASGQSTEAAKTAETIPERQIANPASETTLEDGLETSAKPLKKGLFDVFTKRLLDQDALDGLEEQLIMADIGHSMATRLIDSFKKQRFGKTVTPEEVQEALAESIATVLHPMEKPLDLAQLPPLAFVLMAGVNGSGKTTTLGKLAAKALAEGRKPLLVAGDTFRAAATQQLVIWGERADCPVLAKDIGADSAALAFEAFDMAARHGCDLILMDTAGRLHTQANLMAELEKILRVIRKKNPAAPHEILLTLDGSTGQNALVQVEHFGKILPLTGVVITKLDGSAKGGMVVGLAGHQTPPPVYYIGIGEQAEDLKPFQATAFARALLGLPPKS